MVATKNGKAKPAKMSRRAAELEVARCEGRIEAIQKSARDELAAFDPALFSLAKDPDAWEAMQESFRGWSEDLAELFDERKYGELRRSLRGLLLIVEASVAVEEKACIESGPLKKGGEVS